MKKIYLLFIILLSVQLAGCNYFLQHKQDTPSSLVNHSSNNTLNAQTKDSSSAENKKLAIYNSASGLIAAETNNETIETVAEEKVSFWDDVYENLSIVDANAHKGITVYKKWYDRNPQSIPALFSGAEPFLYLINQQIKQKNMPSEILFLPIIESNYDPYAYSHGGASGIWQMIKITAKRLGVKRNWWYDGRRDIVVSTQAALDYLEFLHNKFDGDWLLAIAAYNAGEGTIGRAQQANRKKGLATDFWSLKLPRETVAYVPKWLAISQHIKEVIADKSRRREYLPDIPSESLLTTVEMKSQIDLSLAAKLTGLSLKQIYNFNPGYNHWATPPQGPHSLLLPKLAAARLVKKLKDYPKEKRVSWIRYQIKSGDSLSVLAHTFKTTVSALKTVNHMSTNHLVAGKTIIIPKSSKLITDNTGRTAIANATQKITTHTVVSGESLWLLAKRFGVTSRSICEQNNISLKTPLQIGQKLEISHDTTVAKAKLKKQKQIRPEILRKIYYPVRRGDSLASIAKKFNITSNNIKKWNSRRHSLLKPGQSLTLYIDVTQQFFGV